MNGEAVNANLTSLKAESNFDRTLRVCLGMHARCLPLFFSPLVHATSSPSTDTCKDERIVVTYAAYLGTQLKGCLQYFNFYSSITVIWYRAEKISLYMVARMLQASWGIIVKLQQEQTSPNHIQVLFHGPVLEFTGRWNSPTVSSEFPSFCSFPFPFLFSIFFCSYSISAAIVTLSHPGNEWRTSTSHRQTQC